uniref:Putative ovule protein n=1 Tax=Solanum chacoense TaxID=4108 RepID=A0A0V0GQH1_SOLCH
MSREATCRGNCGDLPYNGNLILLSANMWLFQCLNLLGLWCGFNSYRGRIVKNIFTDQRFVTEMEKNLAFWNIQGKGVVHKKPRTSVI